MTISKRNFFVLIPFVILTAMLCYTWIIILATETVAIIPHYLGLLFYLPLVFYFIKDKSLKKPIIFTGIYLLLGIVNFLLFLPFLTSGVTGFSIGSFSIWTPGFNFYALIIFVLYVILNFDALTDIYLDYKEKRK